MEPPKDIFRKIARKTSETVGHAWTFSLAVILILVWALTGPLFGFSDTWQLIINTSTTILTFLIVFLIQNTQNRDAKAIHLKLDELINSAKKARNEFIDAEDLSDKDLEEMGAEFRHPEVVKVIVNDPQKEEAKKIIEEFHKETVQKKEEAKDLIVEALKKKEKNKTKKHLTNNDVEALLKVSDATATRYLDELESDGKIEQKGTTGRGVKYFLKK
ncbi:MAG: hypothetical protein COU10_03010 [Candidatus Harrisonbacteria bacterium CG10_big_fil_rev_8_21_14_0_10_45_28]|uniref:Low affinity iron permease family protein n=1 Tax=Candidatus Harrisonbacteria bacterium CG10_big_fil_rev_8_21_14_0_10_45_28 TaxID=1974586 RepID=A0A2H0UMW4_9BACT|nr:MAG: hypothetical protein COU10_03010 [Candidatus Harrisonbacteria bacterium CG10_big_fil_rev_8_21_14_0_10_45_28]